MATAFISHATQDREVAERICSFLEERGIRCWIAPRDVRPGRLYAEEIIGAIHDSDAVVLVLSENANTSKFVEREIERAVSYGKPTLPVRVREVQPSRSLELFISSAHWIDAWKPPMEQYLDRLADSIRSLSPENEGASETRRMDRKKTPGGERRTNSGKLLTLGTLVLVLLLGGATWWFLAKQETNSSPIVSATPASPPEKSPEPKIEKIATPTVAEQSPGLSSQIASPAAGATPFISAPPLTLPSPRERTPETPVPVVATSPESSPPTPSVTQILSTLGTTTGAARFNLLRQVADQLPAQISVNELLALTGQTGYRSDAIKLMVSRLPNPLSVEEMLKILGSTSDTERFGLIRMLAERLSSKITVDNLLALISGTSYRNDAIKLMVNRLPDPLPVDDTLRILAITSENERYNLIRILADRLPARITVDNLLALISGSSYRNEAIKLMISRLPNPLPAEDLLPILGATADTERFNLIRMLVQRLPKDITVDNLLALISGSSYRNEAIKLMISRLPNPLSFEEMSKILGNTSEAERLNLIQVIASHAPPGLSSEQKSALVQGSSYPDRAEKLLSRSH